MTEITERGFRHKLKKTYHFHPRLGLSFTGGEVYLDDEYFRKTCEWKLKIVEDK